MLTIKNGAFFIDDNPTFLFGAECHYFRVDPEQWRDRLLQIKEAGFNLVSTYVPWLWHEPEQGKFDFTGKTHPRRNLLDFLKLCDEIGFKVMVRPGPYVMSELKREGIPEWIIENYSEVIARTITGNLHPARLVSYLHPVFLQLVRDWYDAVLTQIRPLMEDRSGPIVMIQLDNEIGMLQWVTNSADFHPLTMERYRTFVEENRLSQSGKLLNQASDSLEKFSEEEQCLSDHFMWSEFCRMEYSTYVSHLQELVRKNGINALTVINVHGFKDLSIYSRGTDYPIGISQLRTAALLHDCCVAGDFYPGHITYDNFHDIILSTVLTACISSKEQPIFSAEFQSGRLSDRPTVSSSDMNLLTRLCISHGMNALNYYMFCAGDNPEDIGLFGTRHEWQAPIASDGSRREGYATAQDLGRMISSVHEDLVLAKKEVDTHIGFYSPYYMTETDWPPSAAVKTMIQEVTSIRENYVFDGLWRLLAAANLTYDAVDLLKEGQLDSKEYPTLWVGTTRCMEAEVQQKLLDYAKSGGKLCLSPFLPEYDLNGRPCRILADAIQIEMGNEEYGYQLVDFRGHPSTFCRVHLKMYGIPDHEIIATSKDEPQVCTALYKRIERGNLMLLGVGMLHEYQYQIDVLKEIADQMGIRASVSCTHSRVHATMRRGERGSFLSLLNMDEKPAWTQIKANDEILFDQALVQVPARSGLMLPFMLQIGTLVLRYSTMEIFQKQAGDQVVTLGLRATGESGIVCISSGWTVSVTGASSSEESMGDGIRITCTWSHEQVHQDHHILMILNRIV